MGKPAPAFVSASGLPPSGDKANAVLSGAFTGIGPSQPFAMRGPMDIAIWGSANTALTTTAGSLAATVASGTGLAIGDAINSLNVPPGTTWATFAGTAGTLAIPALTIPGRPLLSTPAKIVDLAFTDGLLGAAVTGPNLPAGVTVTEVEVAAIQGNLNLTVQRGIVQISASPLIEPNSRNLLPYTFKRTGNAISISGADAAALFTGAALLFTGSVQLERSFDGGFTWIVCNVGGAGTLAIYSAGTHVSLTFGEPEREVLYRLNCTAFTAGVALNYRISQTGGAAESLAIGTLI